MNKDTPLFTHDCDKCQFLGTFKKHDLYFCAAGPTVVARYGNDGPEYKSGMRLANPGKYGTDVLYEAKLRAIKLNIYKP